MRLQRRRRRKREEGDRMWMWEINSERWGQETGNEANQICLRSFLWLFIRLFHILGRHFPGGLPSSRKDTDGELDINTTKHKKFDLRDWLWSLRRERISLSPGGLRLKTLTWRGSISAAVQSVSAVKVFFSLICCSGWVSDGGRPRGNGHFYQGSCQLVHGSTFCPNTT